MVGSSSAWIPACGAQGLRGRVRESQILATQVHRRRRRGRMMKNKDWWNMKHVAGLSGGEFLGNYWARHSTGLLMFWHRGEKLNLCQYKPAGKSWSKERKKVFCWAATCRYGPSNPKHQTDTSIIYKISLGKVDTLFQVRPDVVNLPCFAFYELRHLGIFMVYMKQCTSKEINTNNNILK